jgi:hypothetical protein
MPAGTKPELLAILVKEFERLERLIEPLAPAVALARDSDDTSIKDVIAHRAHWIDLFLGWYADGLAGKAVHFPAAGYKWNQLRKYNAELRARQAGVGWDEARALLADRHRALMAFIQEHSDADLYGGPMKGAYNDWVPGRWAEAAGPSHYRSAAKYIRSRLKALSGV